MSAYYNEIDPHAAAWLRELIKQGHIADGEVDERSIEDVAPADLAGFRQCHFFAGIGGWSLALRLAGWPDDRPIWTGSCPCQPFSAAGAGAGFSDERHLWPALHWLAQQCRPPVIAGEQVASKHADAWVDLVHADLEAMGYAFGAVPFPAAGIGAPHIRDRLYWVGHADDARSQGHAGHGGAARREGPERPASEAGVSVRVADIARGGRREERADGGRFDVGDCAQGLPAGSEYGGGDIGLADTDGGQCGQAGAIQPSGQYGLLAQDRSAVREGGRGTRASESSSGLWLRDPLGGQWRGADWLSCRDGKWRPVEPGTQSLAHGIPARVVRLRGYGNAIVPQQAAAFVRAFA